MPRTMKKQNGNAQVYGRLIRHTTRGGQDSFTGHHHQYELVGVDEHGREIQETILIDWGVSFTNPKTTNLNGVFATPIESVLANTTALLLTHAHLDHIGAVAHIARFCREHLIAFPPVYGSKITLDYVREAMKTAELSNHFIQTVQWNELEPGDIVKIGRLGHVQAGPVSHATAGSFFYSVWVPPGEKGTDTPAAHIVQTGDLKADETIPVGPKVDWAIVEQVHKRNLHALIIDSTNATKPGFTITEAEVRKDMTRFCQENLKNNRIIFGVMAQNHQRLDTLCALAKDTGRKDVIVTSDSVYLSFKLLKKSGYDLEKKYGVKIHNATERYSNNLKALNPGQVIVIASGTQAEEFSNLQLASINKAKRLQLQAGTDVVIYTASTIPDNRKQVADMFAHIKEQGVRIITEKDGVKLHSSGHGNREDNGLYMRRFHPRVVKPTHGNTAHIAANVELANSLRFQTVHSRRNGDTYTVQESPRADRVMRWTGEIAEQWTGFRERTQAENKILSICGDPFEYVPGVDRNGHRIGTLLTDAPKIKHEIGLDEGSEHETHMVDDQPSRADWLREKIQEINDLGKQKSVLSEIERISPSLKEAGINIDFMAVQKTGFRSEAINALQIAQRGAERGLVDDVIRHMDEWLHKAELNRQAIGTNDIEINKLQKKGHLSEARNLLKRAEEQCAYTDVENIIAQMDETLGKVKAGRDHIHLNDKRVATILYKGYSAKAERFLKIGNSKVDPDTGEIGAIAQKLFAESEVYFSKAQAIALEYDLGEIALKSSKQALPIKRGVHP